MKTKGLSDIALADLSVGKVAQSGPTGDSFTYVDIGSIDRESKRITESRVLPTAQAPSRAKQVLKAGDVLVSLTRPNLNAVAIVPPELDGAIGSTGFHVIRPKDAASQLLYYAVQTPAFVDAMCQKVQGALYPAVRPKDVSAFCIPPSSLENQRRIVEEIETQLTRLDAGVVALRRVLANLKRKRASVLHAACTGQLVPTEAELARQSGKTFESGADLLIRILAERRATWSGRGKHKEPAAPDTTGLLHLTEGWCWASLEQISSLITSGSRGWGDYYSDQGPLFIRAQDIKTDSLNLSGVARVKIPDQAEGTRSFVENNDLLITITGANVTKSAIVRGISETAFVSQHVALIKPTFRITAPYLFIWIISPMHGRKNLEKWAYGAGKPGLNLEQVRSLPIAVPPLAEQQRIVAEVERQLSVIDELETLVTTNLARAIRLRQAILQKAFSISQL